MTALAPLGYIGPCTMQLMSLDLADLVMERRCAGRKSSCRRRRRKWRAGQEIGGAPGRVVCKELISRHGQGVLDEGLLCCPAF